MNHQKSTVLNQRQKQLQLANSNCLYLQQQLSKQTTRNSQLNLDIQKLQNTLNQKDQLITQKQSLIQMLTMSNQELRAADQAHRAKIAQWPSDRKMMSACWQQIQERVMYLQAQILANKSQTMIRKEAADSVLEDQLQNKALLQKSVQILTSRNQQLRSELATTMQIKSQTLLRCSELQREKILLVAQTNKTRLACAQVQASNDNTLIKLREQEIGELRELVGQLKSQVQKKNEILNQLDPQIYSVRPQEPSTSNDQLISMQNSMHFMNKEIHKKLSSFRKIREEYSSYTNYVQENERLVALLKKDVRDCKEEIQVLRQKNYHLEKIKQQPQMRVSTVEARTQDSFQRIVKLLWQNQACHMLLYQKLGQMYRNEIQRKKSAIQREYQGLSMTSDQVDNRYLDIEELVLKNDQLVFLLRKCKSN